METSEPIEWNRQALKRIALNLSGMAEMAEPLASPSTGATGTRQNPHPARDARRPPRKAKVGQLVIPRILWRTIVSMLRPAESAARRLIIAASRGVIVPFVRLRKRKPKPQTMEPILRHYGLAVSSAYLSARNGRTRGRGETEAAIPCTFPLFDPPRRINLHGLRRSTVPPHAAPRIMVPGITEPHRLPRPPADGDLVSAETLIRRIVALTTALDDLPGQAERFARWRARRDARDAREKQLAAEAEATGTPNRSPMPRRFRRHFPLRGGRPYGGRLFRYDPGAAHPPRIREVDEILVHAHDLALYALEYPDTS